MRILAFDHFFGQDLAALADGLAADDSLISIPYRRVHRVAAKHFDPTAFDSISAHLETQHRSARDAYGRWARGFTDWLVRAYAPTVAVFPTDNIFYLRPIIERLQQTGVFVLVLQKETTIAPLTMETDSLEIRSSVPPICDLMTVCSERHLEFALRSGLAPDRGFVTGQPRFDVLATAPQRPPHSPPRILFLSWDDLAYLPPDAESSGLGTWRPLRAQVERCLADAAATGKWDVTAKVHPQQLAMDDDLGPDVHRADRLSDTRELLIDADLVVGFQTTALFEAAILGKPIIYTGWGPVFDATRELLIPFHQYPGFASFPTNPDQFMALLDRPISDLAVPSPEARGIAESHLGPVDGHATERIVELLRQHQREVDAPPLPWSRVPWAIGRALGAAALAIVIRVAQPASGPLRRRRAEWHSEWVELALNTVPLRNVRRRLTTSVRRSTGMT